MDERASEEGRAATGCGKLPFSSLVASSHRAICMSPPREREGGRDEAPEEQKKKKWIGRALSRLLGEEAHCCYAFFFLSVKGFSWFSVSRNKESPDPDPGVEAGRRPWAGVTSAFISSRLVPGRRGGWRRKRVEADVVVVAKRRSRESKSKEEAKICREEGICSEMKKIGRAHV